MLSGERLGGCKVTCQLCSGLGNSSELPSEDSLVWSHFKHLLFLCDLKVSSGDGPILLNMFGKARFKSKIKEKKLWDQKVRFGA